MWNSLHVIILPAVLLFLVPEQWKNTYLGLLTLSGLIIAMVVQPISGMVSDGWISSWGRRRPFILFGTLLDLPFLIILAWSGGLAWVAIGYIGLQFSSNIAHGPMQGLLPDNVAGEQIGRASGIKNLLDMAGLVAAALIAGRLLQPDTRHPVEAIGLVALALAISAAITLIGVREKPTRTKAKVANRPSWRSAFRIDLQVHRAYAWLVLSRLLFLSGIYGIQVFAQYFLRDVLAVPNPIQETGDLLATITVALVVFALVGGWLGDRIGHKIISRLGCIIGGIGCLMMTQVETTGTLLIVGTFIGVGIGLFLTSNWAMANELAPLEEAGKFLGLTNLATAGAGVIGRLEGPVIDLLNHASPGAWWGYMALFITGAICLFASALLLVKVPGGRKRLLPA